ncbi:hypothetical protein [Rhizobium oryziradicis]|uniref:ATP-grasp domain-containing protein n=1 Tax=Rhizobium oryziradicis TaxID=1867956 RepID=A0A1Q8ZKY3_9HYPH|nr:hypothetical protein [Rhizobium oryziradicis]OLP42441.1 hypothetical protein BJF95_13470 [Rhizobium oryziradicis]
MTSYENWSPLYQNHALVEPEYSIPLSCSVISSTVGFGDADYKKNADNISIIWENMRIGRPSNSNNLFPKIGPVSWKEVPAFISVNAEELSCEIPFLFAAVTSRMKIILQPFIDLQIPTFLHLFPFVDFSRFMEVRMTVMDGKVVDAQWQNIPKGTVPSQRCKDILAQLSVDLVRNSPMPNFYLDLCLDSRDANAKPRLVEFNPLIPELKRGV